MSNTRNSIVTRDIRTLRTRLHLVLSTHFSVFGYLVKHYSLCLIYSIKISDKSIERVKETVSLGMPAGENLSWKTHIVNVSRNI